MHIKADNTSSLSARGSINLPKSVTKLYFLAIFPSKKSVIDAIINITHDIKKKLLTCDNISITKTGIKHILSKVSLFGKFIFYYPH